MPILLRTAPSAIFRAETITVDGTITQSTQDGNGPAINNTDLNKIADGDVFRVILSFDGAVAAPGIFDLTGLEVLFRGAISDVVERGFTSGRLTIAQASGFDQFSLFGYLSAGSACNHGNGLDLNFQAPFGQLVALGLIKRNKPFR